MRNICAVIVGVNLRLDILEQMDYLVRQCQNQIQMYRVFNIYFSFEYAGERGCVSSLMLIPTPF